MAFSDKDWVLTFPCSASIAHLVFPKQQYQRERADAALLVDVLQHNNKETVPTLHRLLTNGTDLAYLKLVESLSENLSFRGYNSRGRKEWKSVYLRIQSGLLLNAVSDWNFHNVASETGREWNLREDLKAFDFVRMMYMSKCPEPLTKDESADAYWRGFVAYGMIRMNEGYRLVDEDIQDVRGFIEYAGKHHDIKAVVEAGVSIGSVSLERLKAALEEGTSPTLRQGVL